MMTVVIAEERAVERALSKGELTAHCKMMETLVNVNLSRGENLFVLYHLYSPLHRMVCLWYSKTFDKMLVE